MNRQNPLEQQLYPSSVKETQLPKISHHYENGMFISINNHKQGMDDLCASLKEQYKSILYALTGINIGMDEIKLTGNLPTQKTIRIISVFATLEYYLARNHGNILTTCTGQSNSCLFQTMTHNI